MRGVVRSKKMSLITVALLGMLICSCSHLTGESKKGETEVSILPDCKKNFEKEGVWPFNRVYKTWVKYDRLDYKRGFDAALVAAKSSGYRAIFSDRESGVINAEILPQSGDSKAHPIEIKLEKEGTTLTVSISSSSLSSDQAQESFCKFYGDFERSLKRQPSAPTGKQPSAKKIVEPEREVVQVSVQAAPPAPPPQSPPPSPTSVSDAAESRRSSTSSVAPPKALAKTYVVWPHANLREGPGTSYKVTDKVKKGTPLAILEEREGWLYVRLENGQEAWVSRSATSEGTKAQPSSPSPPARTSSPPASSNVPAPSAQPPKPASPM